MQTFDIIREQPLPSSFRAKAIISQYDIVMSKIEERFRGELDLTGNWKIGLIVGKSGSGKTTIAKEIFKSDYVSAQEYISSCILDDMPATRTTKEIAATLNSVGFSSPPSWLKPYSVLSSGEKMRVDIARALLSEREIIVFDEFTSVVDRDVAKISCAAILKAIRRSAKRFVGVSCHFDIIEWLEPDWILNTDTMRFEVTAGRFFRPQINLRVREVERKIWERFRKYHYLNDTLNQSTDCYAAFYENRPIAFIAVIHNPNADNKRIKRVSRLVVLPDYQGVGIGKELLNFIGRIYFERGFDYHIVTSNPALAFSLKKDKKWILIGQERKKQYRGLLSMNKTISRERITFSWKYIGEKNGKTE